MGVAEGGGGREFGEQPLFGQARQHVCCRSVGSACYEACVSDAEEKRPVLGLGAVFADSEHEFIFTGGRMREVWVFGPAGPEAIFYIRILRFGFVE